MGGNDANRSVISVDVGSCESSLDFLAKAHKLTRSEVVRRAIVLCHATDLFAKADKVSLQALKPPKAKPGPKKMTEEEREVIETYRRTYNYSGRIHHGVVLGCIRSQVKQGFSEEELAAVVRVSKQDAWLANRVSRGEHIPLNEILSDRMVGRIIPLVEKTIGDELVDTMVHLEGTSKPSALAVIRKHIGGDEDWSEAFDAVQAAQNEEEVQAVVERYVK